MDNESTGFLDVFGVFLFSCGLAICVFALKFVKSKYARIQVSEAFTEIGAVFQEYKTLAKGK